MGAPAARENCSGRSLFLGLRFSVAVSCQAPPPHREDDEALQRDTGAECVCAPNDHVQHSG